jgi:hypothetical protein
LSPARQAKGWLVDLHARHLLRPQLRLTTWWRVGRHHVAEIDPFRNLQVDPRTIDRFIDMERDDFLRMRHHVDVVGGDWDLGTTPLDEHFVFSSLRARFSIGAPWEETRLHAVAMEGIESGVPRYHGCRTRPDLDRRLRQLERLHTDVVTRGYRSQGDIVRDAGRVPLRRRRTRPYELDEIIVHIDRQGRFVFVDGIHRLSIAKVAGVPTVPVFVLHRHATWQAHRDEIARTPAAFPPSTFEHPDLAYLRP